MLFNAFLTLNPKICDTLKVMSILKCFVLLPVQLESPSYTSKNRSYVARKITHKNREEG